MKLATKLNIDFIHLKSVWISFQKEKKNSPEELAKFIMEKLTGNERVYLTTIGLATLSKTLLHPEDFSA
jgi:hypothetical protein